MPWIPSGSRGAKYLSSSHHHRETGLPNARTLLTTPIIFLNARLNIAHSGTGTTEESLKPAGDVTLAHARYNAAVPVIAKGQLYFAAIPENVRGRGDRVEDSRQVYLIPRSSLNIA